MAGASRVSSVVVSLFRGLGAGLQNTITHSMLYAAQRIS